MAGPAINTKAQAAGTGGAWRTSVGVLLGGLAMTALIVALLGSTAADRDRLAFEASVRAAIDAIHDRVDTSVALLRGTAGMLGSHENTELGRFRLYVERLQLRERYPGILGIGYSRRVDAAGRVELERRLRAQGQRDFRVWPEGERPEYFPIVYIEPLDERNRAAIGYDMYSEPVRQAAMSAARDGGEARASARVELVQEIDERKQPGFLIYAPVYQGGRVPASLEERRQRLLGFAYSPIRAHDFLSHAFAHETEPSVAVEIYDGAGPQPASLLYAYGTEGAPSAGAARFTATQTVEVAGQPWTFVFRSRGTLAEAIAMPLLVGLAGVAVSIALAVLVRRETAARGEAQLALGRERGARAEAERANLMKDEFLATLSHELRTPLNAIIGWASVLRRGALKPEETAKALEVVDRNAKVQAQLIEDLLDMNRIISGKLRMEVGAVDPSTVLADALASVSPAAEAKGVQLEAQVDPGRLAVHGDPARLQQIAWNLLSNAIKFTARGGRVRVSLQRAPGMVRLIVTDTGEGIEPAFLLRIFDRFAQGDGSITRRHGGLGLGLAIVRQLVELHGGTVRALSEGPGKGATFVVELPAAEEREGSAPAGSPLAPAAAAEARAEPLRPEGHRLEGLRVLVVDDEQDARNLMSVVLKTRNVEVHCAASGEEALGMVRELRPHVLLSDIGMPGMDGYELIRRVRKLAPQHGGEVAAAAVTAYARAEDRAAALRAGFQAHLVKPVRPEDLVDAVASLSGRNSS